MSNDIVKKNESVLARVRPATDILEREDGFYVYMDMPGVAREDLVIDLQDGEITVIGKASPAGCAGESCVDEEFAAVEYRRALSVSDIVDSSAIKAGLKDGVLSLFLPRAAKAQPRKIEVQAG
ncbi:MAG: Hsp20/alpha crystallin family protein [Desulfovibrionaceae bacterium]